MKSVINTGMLLIIVGLALLMAYGLYSLVEGMVNVPSPVAIAFVFLIAGLIVIFIGLVLEKKGKKEKHGWVIDR